MDRLEHAMKFCDELTENRKKKSPPLKTIYIMRCDRYHKIGYANDIYQRLCNYKVHNPLEVSIVRIAKTLKHKQFERWVHDKYADKILHGEWYYFDSNDIKDIEREWFDELTSQA